MQDYQEFRIYFNGRVKSKKNHNLKMIKSARKEMFLINNLSLQQNSLGNLQRSMNNRRKVLVAKGSHLLFNKTRLLMQQERKSQTLCLSKGFMKRLNKQFLTKVFKLSKTISLPLQRLNISGGLNALLAITIKPGLKIQMA